MEEYAADKRNILLYQKRKDWRILNIDSQEGSKWIITEEIPSALPCFFSQEELDENQCVYLSRGEIKFNRDGQVGTICRQEEIMLPGKHNLQNILAASAVGVTLGIEPVVIGEAVKAFKGMSHRLELVRKLGGVSFVNDTAATTPDAALAGVRALNGPIMLIAGGSDKNLNLSKLAEEIACGEKVKNVFLLEGTATVKLKKMIVEGGAERKISGVFNSMKRAVEEAFNVAKEAGTATILLSPGCASFGMFQNEFHRGDEFKAVVKKITL